MKSKGRKYELELKRELEGIGWIVIDVASNAGVTGTFDCDLLCWPPGRNPEPNWSKRQDPHMVEVEVKFRKTATGFVKIYDEHLAGCGLGNTDVMYWEGDMSTSGGVISLTNQYTGLPADSFCVDQSARSAFVESAFKPGVDVVALRASRKPWVFVWRS